MYGYPEQFIPPSELIGPAAARCGQRRPAGTGGRDRHRDDG